MSSWEERREMEGIRDGLRRGLEDLQSIPEERMLKSEQFWLFFAKGLEIGGFRDLECRSKSPKLYNWLVRVLLLLLGLGLGGFGGLGE